MYRIKILSRQLDKLKKPGSCLICESFLLAIKLFVLNTLGHMQNSSAVWNISGLPLAGS